MIRPSRLACSIACLVLTAVLSGCNQPPAAPPAGPAVASAAPAAASADPSPVKRGEQLVTTGLCHDCHTPKKLGPKGPEPDMDRALSGHPEAITIAAPYAPAPGSPWQIVANDQLTAWSGPWGVSFAYNLTPDKNTGLRSGVWTKELFIKALRTGRHMGVSREILPPMPWQFISQHTDEDLGAIWEYLGTIKPINNHVPEPVPPSSSH
jgi:hypothetical protein